MLEHAVAEVQRSRRPSAVLLIDIDHFKSLNDRYGHLAGDRMIEHVAALIRSGLRASDMACRWGGEEFLVVLKDCAADDARQRAETLRALIGASPLSISGAAVTATVSVGVTAFATDDTPVRLVDRADRALYAAKGAGRDRVEMA